MRKFIINFLVFAAPFFILVLPPVYVLKSSGENFRNIDNVILSNNKYLIGYAYNESNYRYIKWKKLFSGDKHTVVAIGSSRVLQFRSGMFNADFFNAGYAIRGINEFVPFLSSIPEKKRPNYLIIGLDQWMFNRAWDNLESKPGPHTWSHSFSKYPDFVTIKSVWYDLLSKKYDLANLSGRIGDDRIGLSAKVNGLGFRNDGSIYYGDRIRRLLSDYQRETEINNASTYDRIREGNDRYSYCDSVNPGALEQLNQLLLFCREKQIKVIGFLPPFSDKVNGILERSGHYKYLSSIYPKAINIFNRNGFELYDFTCLKYCNSNDNETVDGAHGGELTYLRILIKMLEANSVLNQVADLKQLRKDIATPLNNFQVYRQ